jgi:hypothetical protein
LHGGAVDKKVASQSQRAAARVHRHNTAGSATRRFYPHAILKRHAQKRANIMVNRVVATALKWPVDRAKWVRGVSSGSADSEVAFVVLQEMRSVQPPARHD